MTTTKKDFKEEMRESVRQINDLGYWLNANTHMSVFVNMYGHTGGIDVRIAPDKKDYYLEIVHEWRFRSNKNYPEEHRNELTSLEASREAVTVLTELVDFYKKNK